MIYLMMMHGPSAVTSGPPSFQNKGRVVKRPINLRTPNMKRVSNLSVHIDRFRIKECETIV
jgi:hypothetical protein